MSRRGGRGGRNRTTKRLARQVVFLDELATRSVGAIDYARAAIIRMLWACTVLMVVAGVLAVAAAPAIAQYGPFGAVVEGCRCLWRACRG